MFAPTQSYSHVCVFSSDDSKKLVTVLEKYSRWVLPENGMVNRPWKYRLWTKGRNMKKTTDWTIQNTKILYF